MKGAPVKPYVTYRLSCVECGERYAIRNDEIDNYNIYRIMSDDGHCTAPRLLCPRGTAEAVANLDVDA